MHLGNEGASRQQVLMAITLRHRGRVVVEDVDLSYAYGWLSGTQRIGGSVDLSWAGVRGS